jgi:FlaA1/EpsC-like NDP-sugar epimerase
MLVLQSGALGKDGEIFILDMGKEVKIYDLALKMIYLSGRTNIGIDITGLRPGEKLYEELLTDETLSTTKYQSVTIANPTKYNIDKLSQDIDSLLTITDDKQLLDKLQNIVPEFSHKPN